MRVIMMLPSKPATVNDIDTNDIKSIIGGEVSTMCPFSDKSAVIIFNSKLEKPINRVLTITLDAGNTIYGTALVSHLNEDGSFSDLTNEQIVNLMDKIWTNTIFCP